MADGRHLEKAKNSNIPGTVCQCQSWIYIAHKRKATNALVR